MSAKMRNAKLRVSRLKSQGDVEYAYGTLFLPQMMESVRHLQSLPGPDLEAKLPRFVAAAQTEAQAIGRKVSAGPARQGFDRLAQRLIHEELTHLSLLAAAKNKDHRDSIHQNLIKRQIEYALLWPESDERFAQAAENGLSAIEAHGALVGQTADQTEYAQASFLSELLAARLKALSVRNIALAWRVLETHQSWLSPLDLKAVQQVLARQDRLLRARVLADALSQWGSPADWTDKAADAAETEFPHDADFAALVHALVAARVEHHQHTIQAQGRAARNHLLGLIVTHSPNHLEDLLTIEPQADHSWSQLPTAQRQNLLAALARNRTGLEPVGGPKALAKYRWARGMYRRHPEDFAKLDLSAPGFGDLHHRDMKSLIQAQSRLAQTGHADHHRDESAVLRHLFAPHAQILAGAGLPLIP